MTRGGRHTVKYRIDQMEEAIDLDAEVALPVGSARRWRRRRGGGGGEDGESGCGGGAELLTASARVASAVADGESAVSSCRSALSRRLLATALATTAPPSRYMPLLGVAARMAARDGTPRGRCQAMRALAAAQARLVLAARASDSAAAAGAAAVGGGRGCRRRRWRRWRGCRWCCGG